MLVAKWTFEIVVNMLCVSERTQKVGKQSSSLWINMKKMIHIDILANVRLQNFPSFTFSSLVSKIHTYTHLYVLYGIFLYVKPHTYPLTHNIKTDAHTHIVYMSSCCCIDGHASARSLQGLSYLKSRLLRGVKWGGIHHQRL